MNAVPALAMLERPVTALDLDSYDCFIVAFSGGKDSLACVLHLIELGVAPARIELWHHDIDGREGARFMDWPVTRSYCRKVADALGLPIYFSWKEGGFEREMLKDGIASAPNWFETPDGLAKGGGKGKPGTRRKYPQVSSDLKVRWCSAYLKIDIASMALRNQARFKGKRTLFVTGERAEESASRARYKTFEPHRANAGCRHVDHWRPVHAWSEGEVWQIIARHRVNPHPAYRLGWGRLSCKDCIFGSPNQCASSRRIDPAGFGRIAGYEGEFGFTIHRDETIVERADRGTPYDMAPEMVALAMSEEFTEPAIVESWTMPSGAFGENDGPC